MKKRSLWLRVLVCLLSTVMLALPVLTACTKPDPTTKETGDGTTDSTLEPGTDDGTEPESDTEEGTEPEPEPEFPELSLPVVLPTDPAEIVALIDAISVGSRETEAQIDLAYAAWAALSEEDRAKVTNYDALRTRMQELADAYIVKEYMDTTMPHGEIIIGAYYLPDVVNDQVMQDIVDAHLDFIHSVPPDQTTYDLLHKYGIGVMAIAGEFGYKDYSYDWPKWREEGQMNTTMMPTGSITQLLANEFLNHPALWAVDVDEQNGNYWWVLGKDLAALYEKYPHLQTVTNTFPNYAHRQQAGNYSFYKYVRDAAYYYDSDFVSVDHYLFNPYESRVYGYIRDIIVLADLCKDTGRDLMLIPMINRIPQNAFSTSLDQVKYQAYAILAFGGKCIDWACYGKGWYIEQALDENGNKTERYYNMQACNADLKQLSPVYMRYTIEDYTVLNADIESSQFDFLAAEHPLEAFGQKTITDVAVAEKHDVLMGFFEKNLGEGEAFMFVNTDGASVWDNKPISSTVTFRTVSPKSVVTAYVKGIPTILEPDENNTYTVKVENYDGVFVTVTEPASLNKTPAPVAPVGQLTIGGTNISEFSVVIPANATKRETQAAEALVDIIAKATGKTLAIVTDAETPAHVISLGKTTLTPDSFKTAVAALKGDGYALATVNGNLYISGNEATGAGTVFGVYGFVEDYLGVGLYTDDDVVIPTAETVAVADGISESHNPSFLFRETSSYTSVAQAYPMYHKYNGQAVYGEMSFAAEMTAPGSAHYLYGLQDINGAPMCMTSSVAFDRFVRVANQLLPYDTEAEILGCALPNDILKYTCTCAGCTEAIEREGTIMGPMISLVNRLAETLQDDYPGLKVETLVPAYAMQVPATVRPSENVIIRVVMPETVCRYHALNDPTCEANAEFCAVLEAWTAISDNVIVLDQATPRSETISANNPLSVIHNIAPMYDTIQYLKSLGVMGYQQTGYDNPNGELEALRSYLLSRLLWDADMTRDEFNAEMDGFLKAYYGAGWEYIRQYVDKIGNTEGIKHSDHESVLRMTYHSDKDFARECANLWKSAINAAENVIDRRNVERSASHICIVSRELRDTMNFQYFKKLADKYEMPF